MSVLWSIFNLNQQYRHFISLMVSFGMSNLNISRLIILKSFETNFDTKSDFQSIAKAYSTVPGKFLTATSLSPTEILPSAAAAPPSITLVT